MRGIRREGRRLRLAWRASLLRLPPGVLALLGGVVAPPTTSTTAPGPLDPVRELLGPVVDTLLL